MKTRARALVVTAVLAATVVPAAAADQCTGRVTARPDGWKQVAAPDFGTSRAEIRMLEVASYLPSLAYVSDGSAVMRTLDGGCTWQEVYRTAPLLGTVQVGGVVVREHVVDLALPQAPPGADWIYVLTEQLAGDVSRPVVLASRDAGATLLPGAGLPPAGRPRALAASPTAPERAYVAVASVDPRLPVGGSGVWTTEDGGTTWRRATALDGAVDLAGLRVDPADPTRVFGWNAGGLFESGDAGATFRKVAAVSPGVHDVAVGVGSTGTRMLVAHAGSTLLERSDDGGRTWTRTNAPDVVDTVALAPVVDVSAVAGSASVSVLFGTRGARDMTPRGGVPAEVAAVVDGSSVSVVGRLPHALILKAVEFPRRRERLLPVNLGGAVDVKIGKARLVPARTTVTLAPGTSTTLDYRLDLPPVPTPLDVFFLVDTTGSMGSTINGLRSGIGTIVTDLAASGIDARFGIGDFRDYPISPYGGDGDYAYRLGRAVGPVGVKLKSAIENLKAGGGGDGPESTLAALYQTVTGAGDSPGQVPPGRHAGFRRSALRVVVLATDAPFHDEDDYPGPNRSHVLDALRAARVHVVGLSVGGGGRVDLDDTASATGTFAPASGVDCDADDRPDLQSGQPLVCPVFEIPVDLGLGIGPRVSLAPAIVELLRSVRDVVPVTLASDRADVARVVRPAHRVDVKRAHRLGFAVEASCPRDAGGRTFTAHLTASRPGRPLATSLLDVRCSPLVPPSRRGAPAAAPPAVTPVVAAVVPVPPPVQVVPNSQPQANPNPNPNPQPQLNAQAGLATETEQQHQVALAYADPVADTELAAVAVSPDDVAAVQALCTGLALAAAAGTAWALRRRDSPAVAPAFARRR